MQPYNEILIYKKEQTIDTNNHLDDSQKHCTKWKKPVSECYTLYDSIYMTLLKIPDYSDREQNVWQGSGWESLGSLENCSIFWLWWWLHKSIQVLIFLDLYTKRLNFIL